MSIVHNNITNNSKYFEIYIILKKANINLNFKQIILLLDKHFESINNYTYLLKLDFL